LFYGVLIIAVMLFFPEGLWTRLDRALATRGTRPGGVALPSRAGAAPGEAGELLLDVEAVGVAFGGVKALSDVSFRLHRGEVLGLIGPNGAGKSTLMDVLCGRGGPSGGTVHCQGRDISALSARARLGRPQPVTWRAPCRRLTSSERAWMRPRSRSSTVCGRSSGPRTRTCPNAPSGTHPASRWAKPI
ncbi:MAG TPA: ATP-binding cassette domain-containing protein, partial [Phenylobacterium sp.]|nr:ATP-binding cassette domain-containing protein [Phenylobacterium sp.]